jgi:nucleotide-binding universal stress UspA family protein
MTGFSSLAEPRCLLVCTDGSSASQGAIEAAFTLARQWPCRMRLLQVLEYNPGFASQAIDAIQEWEREAREGLQAILSRDEVAKLEVEVLVRQGEVAHRAILAEAERGQPDLIVMGRRGRTGLTGIFMGSVTARVIGLSPVNLLIVPRVPPSTFQRLLLATDGSPYSEAAWGEALALARAWSSQLLAVSVAREEGEFPGAQELLERLQVEADQEGIPLTTSLLQGAPDQAIIQAAQAYGADLLILGSHGRTGLKRLLMGSVTEQVIGRAPCPVLVVKRRD